MFGLTVTGNPPMKPTSEYTIIGKSYANTRDAVQGQREGGLGHRRAAAEHAARPGGASEDARLDAGLGRRLEQDAVPERAGRSSKATWSASSRPPSGKRSARRSRSPPTRSGRSGRGCPATRSCTPGCASRPTGKRRRSRRATRAAATSRRRWRRRPRRLSASYELPFMKHAPIGPTIAVGDAQARRHGLHPHPQPESAGAARTDRA